MAGVMPKVKVYLFLSIICLLINMCIFTTSIIGQEGTDINDFVKSKDYGVKGDLPEDTNATISGFVLSAGSGFIPFFSLLDIYLLGEDLPIALTVITGIVIAIIGAVQVFLLVVIVLNLAPKVLGTGWDV